jgi:hypothetical protein
MFDLSLLSIQVEDLKYSGSLPSNYGNGLRILMDG